MDANLSNGNDSDTNSTNVQTETSWKITTLANSKFLGILQDLNYIFVSNIGINITTSSAFYSYSNINILGDSIDKAFDDIASNEGTFVERGYSDGHISGLIK